MVEPRKRVVEPRKGGAWPMKDGHCLVRQGPIREGQGKGEWVGSSQGGAVDRGWRPGHI